MGKRLSALQSAVRNKYGHDVLETMHHVYANKARPQSDKDMPGMRQYFLQRAETSPQGEGFEKHADTTEEDMFDMLCKLILYGAEEWYELLAGRQRPEEFKNDWKNIGVAFDASSRLRRAGVEYYHHQRSLQLTCGPSLGEASVLYLDPAEGILKRLPMSQLPHKTAGTIRVVSVSDTHLLHRQIAVPPGDLLVHAGDVSYEESRSCDGTGFDMFVEDNPKYTSPQFRDWCRSQKLGIADALKWLADLPGFQHKVLVGGNHDYILEQLGERAEIFCWEDYNVHYLRTQSAAKILQFGSDRSLSVWGSGVSVAAGLDASRAVRSGNSSFQVDVTRGDDFLGECSHVDHADIVVTHTPPVGILLGKEGKTFDAINKLIERVKPRLFVCGHAHNEQDVMKGRHAQIGSTIGVNAACLSTWNYLHGYAIVVDVQPRTNWCRRIISLVCTVILLSVALLFFWKRMA